MQISCALRTDVQGALSKMSSRVTIAGAGGLAGWSVSPAHVQPATCHETESAPIGHSGNTSGKSIPQLVCTHGSGRGTIENNNADADGRFH